MSETGAAPKHSASGQKKAEPKIFAELKVSGHLMTLDPGLFCIIQAPTGGALDHASGLPGVRVSQAPGAASRPHAVSIASFRPDGWLGGGADAALVRVTDGPAQILVTIYQPPNAKDAAPRLQVIRIADGAPAAAQGLPAGAPAGMQPQGQAAAAPRSGATPEVVAHVRIKGDVGATLGEWIGDRGSKRWIEGFLISPQSQIAAQDIEYQAVLGRGWLSPWVEGGQLCGSRGMALPLLGVRFRLRGEAAAAYDISYSATFIDGTEIGPVGSGEPCEAESLAPIEAFQVVLKPRTASRARKAAEPKPAPAPAVAPAPAGRGKAAPKAAPKAKPARRGR